jgi:hypothetical protein
MNFPYYKHCKYDFLVHGLPILSKSQSIAINYCQLQYIIGGRGGLGVNRNYNWGLMYGKEKKNCMVVLVV